MKNIAIILASGVGVRFGAAMPKQFMKLAGKTVFEHVVECFDTHNKIDEILVVTTSDYKPLVEEIVLKNAYNKVTRILIGGSTRQESSAIAISSIHGENHKVLVHDAVRPLLNHATIDRCLDALDDFDCVDTVIPASDTVVESTSDDLIATIPDRSRLRLGQTPQGFRSYLLRKAHALAKSQLDINVTDDCGLVLHFNLAQIKLVQGDNNNIKITYPSDIYLADRLFQLRSAEIEKKDLNHLSKKVIVVFGASRGIGDSIVKLAQSYGAYVIMASRSNGVDIRDRSSVKKVLEQTLNTYKKIDAVINTAGVLKTGLCATQDDETLDELIDINIKGALIVAQEAFHCMKLNGGHITLFTSSSYTRGRAFSAVYAATKSAIVNLTQGLAQEFLEHNVQINAINPERTATPMRSENFGKESAEILLKPEIVAWVALSSLFSDITGEVIDVRL